MTNEQKQKAIKLLKPLVMEISRQLKEEQVYNPRTESNKPVKYLSKKDGERLGIDDFPNFSSTGSVSGMKKAILR